MNNRNPIDDRELDRRIDALFESRVPPAEGFTGRVVEAVRRDRVHRKRRAWQWALGGAAGIAATLLFSARVLTSDPVMETTAPLLVAEAAPVAPVAAERSADSMADLQELFEAVNLYSEALHLEALLAEAGSQLDEEHEQTLEILTYFAGF